MSTVIPFDRARVAELVRGAAWKLSGSPRDYDPLIELIGDARLVLLGEASHRTHEFYRERAIITRRLITEKGFVAVAVEADWPETERVSHYFNARLSEQFDAVIHVDQTRAVEPLERSTGWERGELPETYPHAV